MWWLLIVAKRSQISYDLKFLIVTRTKQTVYRSQSKNANRDDYSSDSSVKLFFLRDWFQCINWLKLKLQLNVFVIQTNRCFIKNKIRDLLCTRRFSIEIFNDYRISLITDLFVTFTIFETKICEIFLITSLSDAYIEICSLKSEHQCRAITFSFLIWIVANRLLDSDLHRYIITSFYFVRFDDVLVSHFSENFVKINRTSKQIVVDRFLTKISILKSDSFVHYNQAILHSFDCDTLKTMFNLSTFRITVSTNSYWRRRSNHSISVSISIFANQKRRVVLIFQYQYYQIRNDVSFKSFSNRQETTCRSNHSISANEKRNVVQINQYKMLTDQKQRVVQISQRVV